MLAEDGSVPQFKVVFLGDVGVGKTSIMFKYCTESFCPAYQPTIGVDFMPYDYPGLENDTRLRLMFWDVAGAQNYRVVTNSFLRKADGAFLVCDHTNLSSVKSLSSWKTRLFEENGRSIPCVILVNKTDVDEFNAVYVQEDLAVVHDNCPRYKSVSVSLCLCRLTVSAKSGHNIHRAIDIMVAELRLAQGPPLRSPREFS